MKTFTASGIALLDSNFVPPFAQISYGANSDAFYYENIRLLSVSGELILFYRTAAGVSTYE